MGFETSVDLNQKKIFGSMRAIGAVVVPTNHVKHAFDCIAFYRGKIFVIEIKNPERLPKKYDRQRLIKELSTGEKKCMEKIEGVGCQYHIITTTDEAIKLLTS